MLVALKNLLAVSKGCMMQQPQQLSLELHNPSAAKRGASLLCPVMFQVFACVVGQKPSKAKFYVNDVNEVVELLAKMAGVPVPPRVDSFTA